MTANEYRVSSYGNINVLKFIGVMIALLYVYAINH